MTTSPRLSRSVPYWLLVAGSAGTLAGGAYLLVERLGGMDARLTDGTATTNDVYVGQIWAILGAILVGAGLIGLALALSIAALRSRAGTSRIEAPVEDAESDSTAAAADDRVARGEETDVPESAGERVEAEAPVVR